MVEAPDGEMDDHASKIVSERWGHSVSNEKNHDPDACESASKREVLSESRD